MNKNENFNPRWHNVTILALRAAAVGLSAAIIVIWRSLDQGVPNLYEGLALPIGVGAAALVALALCIYVLKSEDVVRGCLMVGDWIAAGLFIHSIDAQPLPSLAIALFYLNTGLLYLGPLWGAFQAIGILALTPGIAIYLSQSSDMSQIIETHKAFTASALSAGLLVFFWVLARDRYDPQERRQLKELVQNRAQELEEMQQRTNSIAQMTNATTSTLNFESILHSALDIGLENLRKRKEWRVVSIALLFRDDDRLYVADQIGLIQIDDYRTFSGNEGIVGEALEKAVPVVANSALDDPVLGELTLKSMRSILVIPMRAHYESYGVFIYATEQPNAFPKEQIHALNAIAMQATVALQNASLYNSLLADKERIMQMEQDARKALVRDLHDIPTQTVSAVKMRLSIVRKMVENKAGDVLHEIAEIEEMALRASDELRQVLFKLRPLALESQGLAAALNQLAEKMLKSHQKNMAVKILPEVEQYLTEEQLGTLFYLIEEATSNARKYAEASLITVQAAVQKNVIAVRIADNGKGFDQEAVMGGYEKRGSFGMVNMRERAELMDGTLTLKSVPGKGTVITVMIPIKQPQQQVNGGASQKPRTRIAGSARSVLDRMRGD